MKTSNKKVWYSMLTVACIASFLIIVLSSLFSNIYNLNYYESEYEKYKIYTLFERQDALDATNNIFGFFRSGTNLDETFFNKSERDHLYDVKLLLDKAQLIYYVSLAVFWIVVLSGYLFYRKEFMSFFSSVILYSGIISIAFLALLWVIYFTAGFDSAFSGFHKMFFTGNYAFDPRVSNMKALFPDGFFFDMSVTILIIAAVKSLLLIGFGYLLRKKLKQ